MSAPTPEQIDAILPQTQCGLCGFGGCMPYAEALVYEKASINLCPPGGIKTLSALGDLLQQDPKPFMAEMEKSAKPKMVAIIRESECIGCTKCIPACPVDAILGSAKQMHAIISDECTGCELCVSPCPVDCIDMILLPDEQAEENTVQEQKKRDLARIRFNNKAIRANREATEKKESGKEKNLLEKRNYIQEAIIRAKALKQTSRN